MVASVLFFFFFFEERINYYFIKFFVTPSLMDLMYCKKCSNVFNIEPAYM